MELTHYLDVNHWLLAQHTQCQNNVLLMQQVSHVDGMEQFVLINHVQLPQLLLIIPLIHNVELISLDAQLLLQDKDVFQLRHVNHILL
jgi:hypothetical protein